MTKKQLISEILKIEKVDTPLNLGKKTQSELEVILSDLQVKETVEEAPQPVAPAVDMQALMEQMKAEMLVELKEQARKEVEEEVKATAPVSEAPVRKVDIDRFQPIPVMSVTKGELIYYSKKTGQEWSWGDFGDVEYLEFQELQTMRSGQKRFIDEPMILILDDDVVNYLGLSKAYEKLTQINDLEKVLLFGQSDFEEFIENSPKGIKHTLVRMVKEKLDNEEDISIKKVRYINERFKLDLGNRG